MGPTSRIGPSFRSGLTSSGSGCDSHNVPMNAGLSNTIQVTLIEQTSWQDVGVDDLTVATSDDLLQAQPHRVALGLSTAERTQLVEFLYSLDRTTAGDPPPFNGLFADGFESGDTGGWSVSVGN